MCRITNAKELIAEINKLPRNSVIIYDEATKQPTRKQYKLLRDTYKKLKKYFDNQYKLNSQFKT